MLSDAGLYSIQRMVCLFLDNANNNSQVPPGVLRHILAVMQVSVDEYEALWLNYQHSVKYFDE